VLFRSGGDLTAALERIAERLKRFCAASISAVRVIR
jgi:hypothetical protein